MSKRRIRCAGLLWTWLHVCRAGAIGCSEEECEFRWDLNEPGKSTERRTGLSEFRTDRTYTEKAGDAKLKVTTNWNKQTMAISDV